MRRFGKGKRDKQQQQAATNDDDQQQQVEQEEDIYYFGYGALVNPTARQRRGVNTDEAHAALLPNYRLTFSYGGAANIVEKTGFEVYGIVMKCSSLQDWQMLKDFDAGYDCVEVDVYPLKQKDSDCGDSESSSIAEEDEGFAQVQETPIRARVFVLPKDQLNKGPNPDKIPQERYLKVIASGMRAYGVDPDYINDEIMGVEFIPSRKPDEYLTFPCQDKVPTLSLAAWNKECQRRLQKAAKRKRNLILFRLGEHAIQVEGHERDNPFCVWLKDRLQGPQDSTWVVVQTLFDPDLPLIASPEEVTATHQAWAENQMMEKFQQAGVQATRIVRVHLDLAPTQPQRIVARNRLQNAVQTSMRSLRSKNSNSTTTSVTQRPSESTHYPSNSSSTPPQHAVEPALEVSPRSKRRFRSLRSKLPSLRSSTSRSSSSAAKANRAPPLEGAVDPTNSSDAEDDCLHCNSDNNDTSVLALHDHNSSEFHPLCRTGTACCEPPHGIVVVDTDNGLPPISSLAFTTTTAT